MFQTNQGILHILRAIHSHFILSLSRSYRKAGHSQGQGAARARPALHRRQAGRPGGDTGCLPDHARFGQRGRRGRRPRFSVNR